MVPGYWCNEAKEDIVEIQLASETRLPLSIRSLNCVGEYFTKDDAR